MKKPVKMAKSSFPDPILVKRMNLFEQIDAEGKTLVMHLNSGEFMYSMSGMTGEFWRLINGKRRVSQIMDLLEKKHQPPKAIFRKKAQELLRKLRKHGLVQELKERPT